jgi:hypothetical protein
VEILFIFSLKIKKIATEREIVHKLLVLTKLNRALFNISTSDTFHPSWLLAVHKYPTWYIAANQTTQRSLNNNVTEMAICHKGTPNGIH